MSRAAAHGCSRRHRRWVEQAFIGTLGPKKWPRLHAHLEQCERCREHFNRLGVVDRALAPGSPLSGLAVDRMREHILAAEFDQQSPRRRVALRRFLPPRGPDQQSPRRRVALRRFLPPRGPRQNSPRPRWVWAGLGAAAAACAALLIVMIATPRDPGFAPRGMEQRWPGERPPGVRLFCVDAAASRVRDEVRAVERGLPAPTLRCTMADDLQLAYSTPSWEGLTMVAFSRDQSGTIHYYAPRNGQSASLAVQADAVDMALDWSTHLAVNHRPGSHELEILFFDRPVSAHDAVSGQVAPLERQSARVDIEEKRP